jgi:plastocyanin
MRTFRLRSLLASALLVLAPSIRAQNRPRAPLAELRLHIATRPSTTHHSVTAVIWLDPLGNTPELAFTSQSRYTLLQKNRTFIPHVQVVPVGSVVQFPNADPFFHNVFSMFDGKRFDLGLYEAGTTKSVTFSRPGVSYIFCNIHPEMSAVIISLSTPLYSIANPSKPLEIRNIPPGDYRLHVWVEGALPGSLQRLSRDLNLAPGTTDLGSVSVPIGTNTTHTNEFGKPYDRQPSAPY